MVKRCKLFTNPRIVNGLSTGATILSDPGVSSTLSNAAGSWALSGGSLNPVNWVGKNALIGHSGLGLNGGLSAANNIGTHTAIWEKAQNLTRSLDRNAFNPNTRANAKNVSTTDAISGELKSAVDTSAADFIQPIKETGDSVKMGAKMGIGGTIGRKVAGTMGMNENMGGLVGGMGTTMLFSQFNDDSRSYPGVRLAVNTVGGIAGGITGSGIGLVGGTLGGAYLGNKFGRTGKGALLGAAAGTIAGGLKGSKIGSRTLDDQRSFSIMSIGREAGKFGKTVGQFAWNHRKRLAKDAVIMGGLFTAGNYLTDKLITRDAKKIGLMPNLNPNPLQKQYAVPEAIKKVGDKVWKYTGLMIKENPKESIAGLALGGIGGIGYLALRHQYMKTKNSVMQLPTARLRLYSVVVNGIKYVGKGVGTVLNGIKGFIYDPETGKRLSSEFSLIGAKNKSKWAHKVGNWVNNHKLAVGVAGAAAPAVSFTLGERASNAVVRKPLEKLDKNAFEYEKYQTNLID